MKIFQLDKHFILMTEISNDQSKAHLSVVVPPPHDIPEGKVARWVTTLNPVMDVTFGDEGTGEWQIVDDNRGKKLYDTTTGQEINDSNYSGVGDLPAGTTLLQPEHPEMHWDGEKWTYSDEVKARLDKDAFEKARDEKLQEINYKAQSFINQAASLDQVPEFEVATWPIQAAEAKAYENDETVQTPTLDIIAASRGIDRVLLIEKALQKAKRYESLAAHVAGQRQGYEDRIKAAEDIESINSIDLVYSLPESA